MRELTPVEQAIVEGLSEKSKKPTIVCFDKSDEWQRKLLSGLLQEKALSEGISLIAPDYFSNEIHVAIFGFLKRFVTQYGDIPTKFLVQNEIAELVKNEDAAKSLHYRAELESLYEYYVPGLVESKHMLEQVKTFATTQAMTLALTDVHKCRDGEMSPLQAIDSIQKKLTDIVQRTSGGDVTESWSDCLRLQEQESWLIPNWIEFGSLAMLSGDPFSGKSHILAEIFAAIFKHGTFARYTVAPCAVLLVDAENKRRIFARRLNNALGEGDSGATEKLLRRLDRERITLPLPIDTAPETIRSLIRETKAKTGQDKVLVVIDTLRSVLGADEMETNDMKNLLYPLQRVAQEENSAILLLHHRPKSGATYSGQTSIAGACDFLWLWESDIDTGLGKLSLVGTRGDHEPAIKFALRAGRNHWIPDSETSTVRVNEKENELIEMLENILQHGELKQSDVVKQIQNQWRDGTAPGRDKIRDLIDSLVGSVVQQRKGEKNATYYSLMA